MQSKKKGILRFITFLLIISFITPRTEASEPISPETSGEIRPSAEQEGHYEAQFRLELGSTRFYLTSLKPGDVWFINMTSVYEGVFYIYLFDSRPEENYLLDSDDLIDPRIREDAKIYNETPIDIYSSELNMTVKNLQLNYTATHEKLHYVEIILVENGPDTYELTSSQEIEPYFIPFISAYPYFIIAMLAISYTGFLVKKIRKSMN